MKSIPLCRAGTFLPFVNFLNQLGSPTERLLEETNIPVFALGNLEALIPLYHGFKFIEQAAKLEKIELLGIEVAQRTHISDLGLVGHIVQQSLTLYDLLRTLEQIIPCVNSAERVWIEEEGEQVWLHHHYILPSTICYQQTRLYAVLLHLKAIRLATGNAWQPLELHLNSSRFKVDDVEELAHIPIHFSCSTDAIAMPKALLSLPLPTRRQPFLSKDCIQSWQASAPAITFSESLKQLLQTLLRDGYPDICIAAEATGTSIRSFQRRLAVENLSYSQIVEQVRFDEAVRMLHESKMQLIDIASELGYSDAANFTRAFKRWTGVSPREFRRLHVNI